MKVRISYIVEVDDKYRQGINHHYGKKGKATRQEIKSWFITFGKSMDDDVIYELDEENNKGE